MTAASKTLTDESPSSGYGQYETAFKVDTYKQVHHDSIVKLLECGTMDELTEILEVFAEAFSTPPPQESSSDESMPGETTSQRFLRTKTLPNVRYPTLTSGQTCTTDQRKHEQWAWKNSEKSELAPRKKVTCAETMSAGWVQCREKVSPSQRSKKCNSKDYLES